MHICKCGARRYAIHIQVVREGYPAHTYRGPGGMFVKGSK